MHVPRNPQYNMHICDMGGKGGVGWGNNVYVKWHKHGMYVAQSGWGLVGWGGAITFMSTWTCMDWELLLHLHTHTSCYALGSSFALAHTCHATLWDLLLHFHTHVMLRSGIFSCTCTHTKAVPILLESTCLFCSYVLRTFFLVYACRAASFLFPVFLVFLPGFARALSLWRRCSSALNRLISLAALVLQLSSRCPERPHPKHLRLMAQSVEYKWHNRHLHAIHEISSPDVEI